MRLTTLGFVAFVLAVLPSVPGRPVQADEGPLAEEVTEAERQAAVARAEEISVRVVTLWREGRFREAVPLAREALAIRERVLGPAHPQVATSLNNLAGMLQGAGLYEEARPLYERAIRIKEETLGRRHPTVATSLNNLAGLLQTLGLYEEARPLYERAILIKEGALGAEHPDVAVSLNNLAELLRVTGQHEEALRLLERALEILEGALGSEHPAVAQGLSNVATLLGAAGRYGPARRLQERALAIREKALGAEHPDVAQSLNGLAALLLAEGLHEEARPLFERALRIQEAALGPGHPLVGKSLNNLAELLRAMGHYERARTLFERAVETLEQRLGPDHPAVALSLGNLASLLHVLGLYEQARPLLERSLAIREQALGPDHPDVATSLNNLATLHGDTGRPERARALHERALRIYEKAFGPNHVRVAKILNNLAPLLRADAELEQARVLYERAQSILEKAFGSDHPSVATCSHNLGVLLGASGRFEQARPFHERALAIREKTLGADHPSVATSLSHLADLLRAMERYEEASPLAARSLDLLARHLNRNFTGLQASERSALEHSLRTLLDRWLRLAPHVGRSGYAEVLRFKGLVARTVAVERKLERVDEGDAVTRVEALRAAVRRLTRLANAMPPRFRKEEHRAWQEAYARAAAERDALARRLARDSVELRAGWERLDLTVEDVQRRLGPDEVLLDYLRSDDVYLVWVVRANGEPTRVDLGGAEVIEAAAVAFAERVAGSSGESWSAAGRALRSLVLSPLEEHLREDTRTLYVCPDAALAAVPFAALPGSRDRRLLIDEHRLVNLSMAQELVPWQEDVKPGRGALLVGSVDYQRASEAPETAIRPSPSTLAMVDRAPRGGTFLPLPETETEVRFIESRLGHDTEILLGANATETRVRAGVRGRRVLHLATHGFVRDDLMRGLERWERGKTWRGADLERRVAQGHDPLLLAGLALAGANRRAGGYEDDGILTALEASHLDLDGVDLVVLSACETALGRAEAGQGVIGLVQGFRMGGAKRVIASLWQVDDEATRLLMERLYEGLLHEENPLSPAEALRRAAIHVRAAEGKHGNSFAAPRFWAGFVCYGD